MKALRYKIRYFIFAWTYLESLGYAGILFGWGSLVYVLKEEGFYLDLCQDSTDDDIGRNDSSGNQTTDPFDPNCEERDGMFNLVFTIASTVLGVGIFFLGLVSLKFGTRITRLVASAIFVTGALCIATASKDVPWLIFPGMALMAMAGSGIFATNVQVSFLFPVWGSAVLSLLSGTFDASAGVQLLVKIGYENGISRPTSYYILTAVFTLTLFNTFCLLPKNFIEKRVVKVTDLTDIGDQNGQAKGITRPERNDSENSDQGEEPMEITARNVLRVVVSPEFLFHGFWFVLLHLRHVNYQASINSVLEDILDTDDEVSEYTNAFLYTLLTGTVVSFLPGIVYDCNVKIFQKSKSPIRRRLMPSVCPLILTSLIGGALSAFTLFTDPYTIYAEFVLIVFLRAFLYSTLATYIRQLFPSELFTTLYGILFLAAGLISLVQYALFGWAENHGNDQVYIFLLALCMVTLIHPFYQWRRCR